MAAVGDPLRVAFRCVERPYGQIDWHVREAEFRVHDQQTAKIPRSSPAAWPRPPPGGRRRNQDGNTLTIQLPTCRRILQSAQKRGHADDGLPARQLQPRAEISLILLNGGDGGATQFLIRCTCRPWKTHTLGLARESYWAGLVSRFVQPPGIGIANGQRLNPGSPHPQVV